MRNLMQLIQKILQCWHFISNLVHNQQHTEALTQEPALKSKARPPYEAPPWQKCTRQIEIHRKIRAYGILCIALRSRLFSWTPVYSRVFPCIPVCSCVFLCITVYSCLFRYVLHCSSVFSCSLMYSSVFPCVAVWSHGFPGNTLEYTWHGNTFERTETHGKRQAHSERHGNTQEQT